MFKHLTLKQRESWFAFSLLAPTLLIVLAIIIVPLLANFWISVKPVELADLRPPEVTVFKRARDEAGNVSLRYTLRNTSQEQAIETVEFTDLLPASTTVNSELPEACQIQEQKLTCLYPKFEPKQRSALP